MFRFTIEHIGILLCAGAIAIVAYLVEYCLFWVVGITLSDTISKYPLVAQFYDWFQIGTAMLTLVGASIWAIFSFREFMKLVVYGIPKQRKGGNDNDIS